MNIFTLETCPGRGETGWHCDHETGNRTVNTVVTERTHVCCFCGRERIEILEPPKPYLSAIPMREHGTFLPQCVTSFHSGDFAAPPETEQSR